MKAKLYQIITIACAIAVLMPYITKRKASKPLIKFNV